MEMSVPQSLRTFDRALRRHPEHPEERAEEPRLGNDEHDTRDYQCLEQHRVLLSQIA